MTIDEMQEILKDLEKQHIDSAQLSLKIVGAVELMQKMIQQDEDKAKEEEATTVEGEALDSIKEVKGKK